MGFSRPDLRSDPTCMFAKSLAERIELKLLNLIRVFPTHPIKTNKLCWLVTRLISKHLVKLL